MIMAVQQGFQQGKPSLNQLDVHRSGNQKGNIGDGFYQALQSTLGKYSNQNEESVHNKIDNEEFSLLEGEHNSPLLTLETLNMDLLDDEVVKDLLQVLPDEYTIELMPMFEEKLEIQELMNAASIDAPIQLLAILIVGINYENQMDAQKEQPLLLMKDAHSILHVKSDEEKAMTWKQLAERLIKDADIKNVNASTTKEEILSKLLKVAEDKKDSFSAVVSSQSKDSQGPLLNTTMVSFDHSNSHMTRLQQLVIHSGDSPHDKPSDQQLLKQIQNILNRSQFQQLGNGVQQLNVKLHPQSLGRLDITIQQINGVLVAKMMTTTAVAKELIEGQLQQLRMAFQSQQIQVERIEITQQQTNNSLQREAHDNDENQSQHFSDNDNTQEEENDENDSFSSFLEETINLQV
ncbi:flagellar hook-length control protein FliK [Evansella sp. AB-P1]|uniref:flagellar hook-length control protein FliK n=1 Tax=Evansella sp. AB-P1 TaxID=3037653 RepID=UPI00241CDB59|nr:flagellar hook-length control protein FliK [Evansella sp. AB-P1]MDG5788187.1 flagellar hook-length control protein FliK [Evansella sp. AB-P1]